MCEEQQPGGSYFCRKEISADLGGDEAETDPNNESAETRGRFVFTHSKEAKTGGALDKDGGRNEDDEPEREESEGAKGEHHLVLETENYLLLTKRNYSFQAEILADNFVILYFH